VKINQIMLIIRIVLGLIIIVHGLVKKVSFNIKMKEMVKRSVVVQLVNIIAVQIKDVRCAQIKTIDIHQILELQRQSSAMSSVLVVRL